MPMSSFHPIAKDELLAKANELLLTRDDAPDGLRVNDVEEKNGVFIFKGEYFLDARGLPTERTTRAFNLYKWLTQQFSGQYTILWPLRRT